MDMEKWVRQILYVDILRCIHIAYDTSDAYVYYNNDEDEIKANTFPIHAATVQTPHSAASSN